MSTDDIWPDQGDLDPRAIWGIPPELWQLVSDMAKGYGWDLDSACRILDPAIVRRDV
jgi:hypothetical protein